MVGGSHECLCIAPYLEGFGLTCLKFVQDSQSMDLILSEEPSTEDRNVQSKPHVVGVGTLVDILHGVSPNYVPTRVLKRGSR